MRVSGAGTGAIRSLMCIILLVPQSACGAGWHQIAPSAPTTLPPRQQIEVWHDGRAVRLHAVQLTNDSVVGVPYLQQSDCDSCRVGLPRTAIDSLRTGNPAAGLWKTIGLTVAGMLVVGLVACAGASSCQLSD
jgi:hypothetical protein